LEKYLQLDCENIRMNNELGSRVNDLLRAAAAAESQGNGGTALASYRELLRLDPEHPGALLRIAQAERREGKPVAAIAMLRRATASARERGLAALALPIHSELVVALREGDANERLRAVREALADCGEVPGLIWEECECLRALGEKYARVLRLNRLAALQPKDPVVLAELGLALLYTAPLTQQSIKPLRDAIALGASGIELQVALATVEIFQNDAVVAEPRLREVLREHPNHLGALAKLWQIARSQCRWSEAASLEQAMLRRIDAGDTSEWLRPFALLDSEIAPETLRNYAIRVGKRHRNDAAKPAKPIPAYDRKRRVRIGYLSGDFHTHAVACHVIGLIEAHDRSRVETFAYSCGARVEDDPYRLRFKNAFAHWRDLNEATDADAAQTMENDALDVLVDLSGTTHGNRSNILALRPAPRVIHYLGYPGTIASGDVDYLLADATVAPLEHDDYYCERILRMPLTYQVNDRLREHPTPPSRASVGLPDKAIVLCNFNRAAKWTEPFMRIWLGALKAHPSAVLWLPSSDETQSRTAVNALAHEFGVAKRVLWAPILPMTEHLARLGCADLSLDQLPYSSHATGANSLWMGVPLLTCLGEMFQGRVGASLAKAAGLDAFVTTDPIAYEQRLHQLIEVPQTLADAKRHLLEKRAQLPLFDSVRFAKAFEDLLVELCA
jgi:protein O-GlcNAc transferase